MNFGYFFLTKKCEKTHIFVYSTNYIEINKILTKAYGGGYNHNGYLCI